MTDKEKFAKLNALARFKNLFNPLNLSIGLNVWIRSSGIQLIISVVFAVTGLLQQLGQAGMVILLVINFALLQWAVTSEARHRFDMAAPPTAWFSVFWRVLLYTLPVAIVLVTVMIGPVDPESETALMQVQSSMLTIQLILLFISIIPMGIATSQTLRNFILQTNVTAFLRDTEPEKRDKESPENEEKKTNESE